MSYSLITQESIPSGMVKKLFIGGLILAVLAVFITIIVLRDSHKDTGKDYVEDIKASGTTWKQVYKWDNKSSSSALSGSTFGSGANWMTAWFQDMKQPTSTPSLVAYGDNRFGQLGDGTVECRDNTVNVQRYPDYYAFLVPGESVVHVDGGGTHTMFLLNTGVLWGCGGNFYGQLGIADNVKLYSPIAQQIDFGGAKVAYVACGYTFTVAVMDDGVSVYMFGSNAYEYTDPDHKSSLFYTVVPVRIESNLFRANNKIVQVACGDMHIILVFEDGSMCGWGSHQYGQLANITGSKSYTPDPVLIKGLPNDAKPARVVCGSMHTSVLTTTGEVYTVGAVTGASFSPVPEDSPDLMDYITREWVRSDLNSKCVDLVSQAFTTLAVMDNRSVYQVMSQLPVALTMPEAVVNNPNLGFRLTCNSSFIACSTDAGELYVLSY